MSGPAAPSPLLRLERAAMIYFGVPSFGVHLNGYVRDAMSGRPAAVCLRGCAFVCVCVLFGPETSLAADVYVCACGMLGPGI